MFVPGKVYGALCDGTRTRRSRALRRNVVLALVPFVTVPVSAQLPRTPVSPNHRCLNCHGQPHIADLTPIERGRMVVIAPEDRTIGTTTTRPTTRPSLYLGMDALTQSVHADLACVDCHTDTRVLPHSERLESVRCATSCHTKAAAEFRRSAHAEAAARGVPETPGCTTCHGGHDIRPKRHRRSRTFPLNVVAICGDCHEHHLTETSGEASPRNRVTTYLESVHGLAVSRGGLLVAATCVDCHGGHVVLPARDADSAVHRNRIPQTCGRCHLGIKETYETSIHGEQVVKGNERAPVCTDCHTAHEITHADTPEFLLDIVGECGACHDDPVLSRTRRTSFYRTYRLSYHGQVTELGSTRAARCSDCHGAHDIRPINDAASRLHPDHRIDVCRTCHEGADARLVQFEPHADFRDGHRYPLLHAVWLYFIIVMSVAFGFFGLHSVLWFVRSAIERVRNGPSPRYVANPHAILRFSRLNRINHAFVIVSFFGLTITGLPLLFSDQPWARSLAGILGGGNVAGILHRVFGVMLLGNLVAHLVGLFQRMREVPRVRAWVFGPGTILPRLKDIKDCAGMFRWFIRGGSKPAFDRWTYWEKFDYAGEIIGTLIIGGSGLLLWFPTFFSQLFPGWIFNVAMIVHGYEALLAVGFIFTIHFFNAHLRLEKFPVDDVIFTGRLPEEEFRHERGAEYARLVRSGELECLKVPPAPRWQRTMAVIVGITAMTIGTVLVVLIVLAGLSTF